MKKTVEIKYPHSANLFQFCRRVLDHKFGGIRVIDQDVGQILGFDPADCSHWKKGKKNVRSIQAMKLIADHLGVDERLVVDVAAGELDDTEAYLEFSGYGAFSIDTKAIETAKKDYYRRHSGSWNKELEGEFKEAFSINESAIDSIVSDIHARINFNEAPLYLPEVAAAHPGLSLVAVDESNHVAKDLVPTVSTTRKDQQTLISYRQGSELRPFMRYRIAKAMASHFLNDVGPRNDTFPDLATHISDVQGNLFAAKLLAPANLLRREITQVNVARDVISQLAEAFWVSKTFMNRRLKDMIENNAAV
jgi:hypothetical protein